LACLGLIAVSAVVLVAAVLFGPTLLRKVGVFAPTAEERYSGAADPVGTEMVSEALDNAGIEGAEVVVMPVKGSDGQIAVITLNESSRLGSINSSASGEEQFRSLVRDYAQANRDGDLRIDTVALDFQGEDGESLVSVGVPQEAIDAYAAGEITRSEFVEQVEIDFSNLISPAELRQLIAEMEAAQ
jgi:hypothetical protein